MEKLIVPSCVKELGDSAFCGCKELCEIVFEPGSQLERIGNNCFCGCRKLREIVVPESVQDIGESAFSRCKFLYSFRIEEGSRLRHVGKCAFEETCVMVNRINFPDTVEIDRDDDRGDHARKMQAVLEVLFM